MTALLQIGIHLVSPFLDTDKQKNGFTGPKSFGASEKRAPGTQSFKNKLSKIWVYLKRLSPLLEISDYAGNLTLEIYAEVQTGIFGRLE